MRRILYRALLGLFCTYSLIATSPAYALTPVQCRVTWSPVSSTTGYCMEICPCPSGNLTFTLSGNFNLMTCMGMAMFSTLTYYC